MAIGMALGTALNLTGSTAESPGFLAGTLFPTMGSIFVRSLQLLVMPLVLLSLMCGTAALDDVRKLGRIGAKTLAFYLATTAIAITIAIGLATLVNPGKGFELNYESDFALSESPPLAAVIVDIFPSNPFQAMAEGKMLQVIVFSILFGIAMCMAGNPGKRVLAIAQDLNDVVMKLVSILMLAAPFGILALVGKTFALEGFGAIIALGKYFFLVLLALAVHAFFTYGVIFKLFTGLSVKRFFAQMRRVQLFAFSTASSNATLPLNLENAEHNLGVKPAIASFTIPLGATVNMDGTAIMQGVATVFISWMYIRMMGPAGLTAATKLAILNANYVAKRLEPYFPVVYRGNQGLVAHECIIDLRDWKAHGIEVEDAAKRLMDYGFHAPTMSFPVAGTFMIEPTESESLAELDRFCDALIAIHGEMQAIVHGESDAENNPLKHAPHTARVIASNEWSHPYSRELAAFPSPWTRQTKFWPSVGRVDNVYGDRNLVCSCVGMAAYAES